jgi:hypothetical protein
LREACKPNRLTHKNSDTPGGHVTPGHEWDLCELSEGANLRATGEHFAGEPPQYRRGDKGMSTIYAEL